jgi:hypothetical protein
MATKNNAIMALNFFEVINRLKQQPKDDREDQEIDNGECNVHNIVICHTYTKQVPRIISAYQIIINQLFML